MKKYSQQELSTILSSTKRNYPSYPQNINKRINQIGNFDFESRLKHYRPKSIFDPAMIGGLDPGIVGGWKELDRTTLGSVGDTVTVTGLANKQYFMLLADAIHDPGSGSVQHNFRYGNGSISSSTIYTTRYSQDGGSDATGTSQNASLLGSGIEQSANMFSVNYMANLSAEEKLVLGQINSQSSSGAATVPVRGDVASKFVFTSNPVVQIQLLNAAAGDFDSGTELVILGWDPSDIHTDNFWEQIATVSGDGTSATLNTGTFTAKKYMWAQVYVDLPSGATVLLWRFNSDSGSNYSSRHNRNGTEGTNASISHMNINLTGMTSALNQYFSGFFINNASHEKLGITQGVAQDSVGAATNPKRSITASKWANTSVQATSLQIINDAGVNFGAKTKLVLWGSD